MNLLISETLLDAIRRHGAATYPHECCGALLGRVEENGSKRVLDLLPLDNRREGEAARTRFLITAEDHLFALRTACERKLDIIGFYHSHPDHPARPSEFDREHALPWYSYVVVRVAQGQAQEITSWMLADDRSRFEPEPLVAPASSHQERG